jgi:hypothetical protein
MELVPVFFALSLCVFAVCAILATVRDYTSFGCSDDEENVYNGNSYSRRQNWGFWDHSPRGWNADETPKRRILAPNRVDWG